MTITLNRDYEGNDAQIQFIAERRSQYEQLRDTVSNYLTGMDAPFVSSAYDQTFYDQCIQSMENRGWSKSTQAAARTFLHGGVAMGRTAYVHMPHHTQIYISIYTAIVLYIDDISVKEDISAIKNFSKVFVEERSHGHEILDVITELLHEIPEHFGDIQGSIILSASLRFFPALVMEQEIPQSPESIRKSSIKFPRYLRNQSGIGEAYAMFMFPPSIPYTAYVQAIPDMLDSISFGNDILSIYKEELTRDESNLVSLLASSEGVSKIEVLRQITEEALRCDGTVLKLLNGNQEALDAYMCFRHGYVAFHTCLKRYRLRELLDL